jgi:hypothetical protein
MPYDPNFPTANTLADAVQVRGQFNSLKDLIDTKPGITEVVVDSVTTLAPGEAATVTLSIIGTVLHMSLALPQGQPGPPGLQGPPFANVVIDSITTLNPGENATVTVFFDGSIVHFSFGIPRGAQGEQGIPGIQGAPGEVTTTAMNGAIATALAGTSAITNSVPTMDTPFADNPDAETLRLAFNALVLALRR